MFEDKNPPGPVGKKTDRTPEVDTGGAAYVNGNVNTGGGHFVGRDYVTEESTYNVQGLPNPYLGLGSFTYNDRHAYAGRKRLIEQSVERITNPEKRQTLTFVTGASGSGKSSFAQAGLLPALENHYKQRHKSVRFAIMRPLTNPESNLFDAFEQLGIQGIDQVVHENIDLSKYLNKHTSPEQVNLIIIDQFEELFNQSSPEGREFLIGELTRLSPFSQIRTHFIATLRSDYIKDLFDIKNLWDLACQAIELRVMSVDEIGDAIRQPLLRMSERDERYLHKAFEPSLIARLSEDASKDATFLPLLQVTLEELWRTGKLKLENYNGLSTAISRRADIVYDYSDYDDSLPRAGRQSNEKDQIIDIFCDLVSVSLDDIAERDVRRSRQCQDLTSISSPRKKLIEDLIAARLLSIHLEIIDNEEIEVVNIIHDSLIQNWQLLKDNIQNKRKQLKRRKRFEQELSGWERNDFADTHLLTGIHLREAKGMLASGDIAVQADLAQEFVTKSIHAENRRRERILFWRNIPSGSVGGGIGFSLACIIIFFNQRVGELSILIIAGLIIYFFLGLFSAGLITSIGITITQTRVGARSRLVQWSVGGIAGMIGFSTAVIFISIFASTQGGDTIGLVIIEGMLWGLASGVCITWGLTFNQSFWTKFILVCTAGGSALIIGEYIGKGFLFENPVAVPSVWQLFIAGALVPAGILTGLSLANRRTYSK